MKTIKILFLLVGLSISSMGFGIEGGAGKEQLYIDRTEVVQLLLEEKIANNKHRHC